MIVHQGVVKFLADVRGTGALVSLEPTDDVGDVVDALRALASRDGVARVTIKRLGDRMLLVAQAEAHVPWEGPDSEHAALARRFGWEPTRELQRRLIMDHVLRAFADAAVTLQRRVEQLERSRAYDDGRGVGTPFGGDL